jgi:Glycerophosphoryl diester phosphodiesterase
MNNASVSFRLIAHRGAPMRAPENTLASFRSARELGATEIETDVQLTTDGVLVLCHDDTLRRYGHGDRPVESCPYAGEGGLAALDFGAWFSPEHAGERIATLDALIDAHARDFVFHIELKGAHERLAAETIALLGARGVMDRCVLTSFSYDQLARARKVAPRARLGWLVKQFDDAAISGAMELGLFQLCPVASSVTSERVEAARRVVAEVRAWGCPREAEEARRAARRLAEAGCVGLTVDEPGWFA